MGKLLKKFRWFLRPYVNCFSVLMFSCLFASLLVTGCGVNNTGQLKLSQEEVFADFESLDSGNGEIKLGEEDSVHISSFGYNERNWQPAQLQDFSFPINWLGNGQKLADQVYIVKQVGKSALFCLIKTNEKASEETIKRSSQYVIFLVRVRASRDGLSWAEYLKNEYGANFRNFRALTIGETEIVHLNWNVDQYWNAPVVIFGEKEVRELTLIYRGFSRSYANQIMNKFPWKVLANN